ncbi:MAG: hypothetical protein KGL39_06720 [Patescibacteria group bacterium]|nr:hypothetical protein [Patescibacteria group bacterium]
MLILAQVEREGNLGYARDVARGGTGQAVHTMGDTTMQSTVTLSADMMREIGAYTHKDEAGRRMYLSDETSQWGHLAGVLRTIPAQVHPGTGLSYSSDDPEMGERVEVHPSVVDWFDAHGDLLDEYEDGITYANPPAWPARQRP